MTPTPRIEATPSGKTASAKWAALLGLLLLLGLGGGYWLLARPKPLDPAEVLERYVGRWIPDWERMHGEPGTLGASRRGLRPDPHVERVLESWQRQYIALDVDRNGQVRVVARADPMAAVVSRHTVAVEGDQLRLRGVESDGKPLPASWESVLRLRRDGVLRWIPLFGGTELTVLLRRP